MRECIRERELERVRESCWESERLEGDKSERDKSERDKGGCGCYEGVPLENVLLPPCPGADASVNRKHKTHGLLRTNRGRGLQMGPAQ